MPPFTLRIARPAYGALRRHSAAEYPDEACGVLLGRMEMTGRIITAAVACRNVSSEPRRNRYEISPKELVQIQRGAREHNEEILGFYHSHPDHPAQWSQTDLEQAYWFGCSYVITSVMQRGVLGETASFLLNGKSENKKHFENEVIEILDL